VTKVIDMLIRQGNKICDLKYATVISVEGNAMIVELVTGTRLAFAVSQKSLKDIFETIKKSKNEDGVFLDISFDGGGL